MIISQCGPESEIFMAFDGIFTGAVAFELNEKLRGAKVEKIYQPERDELVFHLHSPLGNHRLYASCGSSHPGVYLTSEEFQNPDSPGSFCMLLRKHIGKSRISHIYQKDSERIIEILFTGRDEMGYGRNKKLIFEIMGKHSNIILVDADDHVITDSIKRISQGMSRIRPVLPGRSYDYPPTQEKISLFSVTLSDINELCLESDVSRALLSRIQGLSPLISDQLSTEGDPDAIFKKICMIRENLIQGNFAPAGWLKKGGEPQDFHVIPILAYCELDIIHFESPSETVSWYYKNKDSANRIRQKSSDLNKIISSALKKQRLKKQRLCEDLLYAEESKKFRLYGELLTANIHLIKQGEDSVRIFDYNNEEEVTIPLDTRLSAAQNAQIYFKKFRKSKTALVEKQKQLSETDSDITYLESSAEHLKRAEKVSDIESIRDELVETGFVRKRRNLPAKKIKAEPFSYLSSEGYVILAGKNNRENDFLTFKKASRTDLWFHTKDIPGSHVILLTEGGEPGESSILEAAALAAYHSKGRSSENVPVDYTHIRYVKKPSGAKPGMCIFTNNKTLYVKPSIPGSILSSS